MRNTLIQLVSTYTYSPLAAATDLQRWPTHDTVTARHSLLQSRALGFRMFSLQRFFFQPRVHNGELRVQVVHLPISLHQLTSHFLQLPFPALRALLLRSAGHPKITCHTHPCSSRQALHTAARSLTTTCYMHTVTDFNSTSDRYAQHSITSHNHSRGCT